MADPNAAAAYSSAHSPGNPDQQQYVQHQYAYQAQTTSPGGHQYYSAASGIEQQQADQDNVDPQAAGHQGQEVNYAQYTRSGAEGGNEQQGAGGGFADQSNAGIIQQYAGAAGQLAQQQGQNGYKINFDPNPQIIRKQAGDAVTYKQEVAVRYLRPPTPPPPGPLIIKEVRKRTNEMEDRRSPLCSRSETHPYLLHLLLSFVNDPHDRQHLLRWSFENVHLSHRLNSPPNWLRNPSLHHLHRHDGWSSNECLHCLLSLKGLFRCCERTRIENFSFAASLSNVGCPTNNRNDVLSTRKHRQFPRQLLKRIWSFNGKAHKLASSKSSAT